MRKALDIFPIMVKDEIQKARINHANLNSAHEGYAVILEELDEFWEEVKMRNQNKTAMVSELVQVAAMCQRLAEDVLLIGPNQ
jgi:hypothetical protein